MMNPEDLQNLQIANAVNGTDGINARIDAGVKKQQQDRTIKEAIKALEAGATLITDNIQYIHYNSKTKQQRPINLTVEEFKKEDGLYNLGEKRLYENLKAKDYNYSEITVDGNLLGVWKKQSVVQERNSLKDEENSLSLPTEEDSWKEEDNNDTCTPF